LYSNNPRGGFATGRGISAIPDANLKSKTATQNQNLPEFPDVRTCAGKRIATGCQIRTGYRRGRTYPRGNRVDHTIKWGYQRLARSIICRSSITANGIAFMCANDNEIRIFKMRYATSSLKLLTAAIVVLAASPAFSQAPTQAQRDAIRSACRADYEAHCASVPPGGAASLQCLQKNMSSLSLACQSAVHAVEPAAAAKPEAAPAAANPEAAPAAASTKPAAETAAAAPASKPSDAQISAIRSACRSDYPKVCAGVPTGGAAALQCLEKNKAKVSTACGKAIGAVSAGGATEAAAPAASGAAPAAAPTAVMVLRPMRPREELFVLRSACGGDVRSYCADVAPGGGRIARCLGANAASLSPACKEVLAPFAAR
jgi:hypothetical protein